MRVIKFRIYNSKTNKWIHGPGQEVNLLGEIILLGGFRNGVSVQDLNDLVVCQYAGFEDIHGRAVYENDIVKYKQWQGSYQGGPDRDFVSYESAVKFESGCFYPRPYFDDCEDPWYSFKLYNFEVIGNIFDTLQV